MIQYYGLTMILIKLVIGLIHEKCLLTQKLQKTAQEVMFSGKRTKEDHPVIYSWYMPVHCSKTHGTVLDEKRNYNTPVKEKLSKVYKSIQLHRNLSNKRSRQSLVAIWKVFIRPHLDYGDTVYNKPNNEDLLIELKKHNMI